MYPRRGLVPPVGSRLPLCPRVVQSCHVDQESSERGNSPSRPRGARVEETRGIQSIVSRFSWVVVGLRPAGPLRTRSENRKTKVRHLTVSSGVCHIKGRKGWRKVTHRCFFNFDTEPGARSHGRVLSPSSRRTTSGVGRSVSGSRRHPEVGPEQLYRLLCFLGAEVGTGRRER